MRCRLPRWSFGVVVPVVVTAAVVTATVAAAASHGPAVTTLAYTNRPVLAFAHDGPTIAWASNHGCLAEVRIRSIPHHTQRLVGTSDFGGHCDYLPLLRLVLGGRRVIWTHVETGNEY